MAKTLLLIKLLCARDLRSRSLLTSQHPYVSLQLGGSVEVRSAVNREDGRNPVFNELKIIELGPWWRSKECVLQVMAQNRVTADGFIGGAMFTLGQLVRACGLTGSSEEGYVRSGMTEAAGVQGTHGECFQKVGRDEVKEFGELLPVLPGTDSMEEEGEEGVDGRDEGGPGNDAGGGRSRRPSCATSPYSSTPSLPVTWILLNHGGGAAKLKSEVPRWHKPAGRLALYVEFIVIPPAAMPRIIMPVAEEMEGEEMGESHAPGAVGTASTARRPVPVSLPSAILPAGWPSMNPDEKLAWAYTYRMSQRAATQRIHRSSAGVLGRVAAAIGGGGGQSSAAQRNQSARSSPSQSHPHPHHGRQSDTSSLLLQHLPWPLSGLLSALDTFRNSTPADRIFYGWFAVLGAILAITEIVFQRDQTALATNDGLQESGGEGAVAHMGTSITTSASASASIHSFLPALSFLTALFHYVPLLLSFLCFKLAWNMLHETEVSRPWRRLDLVLTLVLGVMVGGSGAQIASAGTTASRVVSMVCLAAAHGYARAMLYPLEIVTEIVDEQLRVAVEKFAQAVGAHRPPPIIHPPTSPFSMPIAFGRWVTYSLKEAYDVAVLWSTGKTDKKNGIPGLIHLSLRSFCFVVGEVFASWLLVDWPQLPRSWIEAITTIHILTLLMPLACIVVLLLIGGGKKSRLRGKPWLILFGLSSLCMLYGAAIVLTRLIGFSIAFIVHTIWCHKWPLLGLVVEYIFAALFIPTPTFQAAAAQAWMDGLAHQYQAVKHSSAHHHVSPPMSMVPVSKRHRRSISGSSPSSSPPVHSVTATSIRVVQQNMPLPPVAWANSTAEGQPHR